MQSTFTCCPLDSCLTSSGGPSCILFLQSARLQSNTRLTTAIWARPSESPWQGSASARSWSLSQCARKWTCSKACRQIWCSKNSCWICWTLSQIWSWLAPPRRAPKIWTKFMSIARWMNSSVAVNPVVLLHQPTIPRVLARIDTQISQRPLSSSRDSKTLVRARRISYACSSRKYSVTSPIFKRWEMVPLQTAIGVSKKNLKRQRLWATCRATSMTSAYLR